MENYLQIMFLDDNHYIQLINPNVISTPFGSQAIIESNSNLCLSLSSFTCGQIFTITINQTEINCPPANLTGDYKMSFNVNCRDNETICNTFIEDHGGSLIELPVFLNYIDINSNIC